MKFSFNEYQFNVAGLSAEATRFGERIRDSYLGRLAVEPVLAAAGLAAELAGYERDISKKLRLEAPVNQVMMALAELRKHDRPDGDNEIRSIAAALAVRGVAMADSTEGISARTTQSLAQETVEALDSLPEDVDMLVNNDEIGQMTKLADPFPKSFPDVWVLPPEHLSYRS